MNGADDAVEVVGVEEGVGGVRRMPQGRPFTTGFPFCVMKEIVTRSSGLWHVTNAHSIPWIDGVRWFGLDINF